MYVYSEHLPAKRKVRVGSKVCSSSGGGGREEDEEEEGHDMEKRQKEREREKNKVEHKRCKVARRSPCFHSARLAQAALYAATEPAAQPLHMFTPVFPHSGKLARHSTASSATC